VRLSIGFSSEVGRVGRCRSLGALTQRRGQGPWRFCEVAAIERAEANSKSRIRVAPSGFSRASSRKTLAKRSRAMYGASV